MAGKEIIETFNKLMVDIKNQKIYNEDENLKIDNLEYDTQNVNGLGDLTRTDQISGILPPHIIPLDSGVNSVNGFIGDVLLSSDDINSTLSRQWARLTDFVQINSNANEINSNNGLGELSRTDTITGLLPSSIIPSSTPSKEYHEWRHESGSLPFLPPSTWYSFINGFVQINDGLGTFNANGLFTCGVSGEYSITFITCIVGHPLSEFNACRALINGTTPVGEKTVNVTSTVNPTYFPYTAICRLNVNDTVQAQMYHNSSNSLQGFVRIRIVKIGKL